MSLIRVCLIVVALASAALVLPGTGTILDDGSGHTTTLAESDPVLGGPPVDYVYRNFSTVVEILYATESEHSDIAKVYDIGDSWEKTQGIEDRDILAIKISDNVDSDEDEPEVLMMALQHAREWPTSEIALQLIENLTDSYGSDARITWLVDNRETWIIPVVNPDGLEYAMTYDDMWRKNRRDNGDVTYGVDLNRNYNGSQNGDPLGEWGGEGASHTTSDYTYCGEYPFSEPETQAVRDLVKNHSFAVAIDFHTYSDLVMWPWGYTVELPPDSEDLVRIGYELAALNGYEADQSVGLYPTTGDSLDWLYGSADIFAFLFEVGGGPDFNPDGRETVLEQIAENIPPALLLLEIAGDREERQFDINHTPLDDTLHSDTGFEVDANITAARGVDTSSLSVAYRTDGGPWAEIGMSKTAGNDTYSGAIPSLSGGSVVSYYVIARDEGGVGLTSPRYAPYDVHTFTVMADAEPPVADAGPDAMISIGSSVSFDGSDSTDNVGVSSYTWVFVYNGSDVELYGESPSFTFWTEGTYDVTLEVTDGSGNSDSAAVTVTVMDGAIPEFGYVAGPVTAILAVFVFARFYRDRGHRRSAG